MKNKHIFVALLFAFTFFGCSHKNAEIKVPNKEKPVLFYNRQPGDPATGKLDMKSLNWNADTFFVGGDSVGGGAMQGSLVVDYLLSADAEKIDRNGDGVIGYVLCIGTDTQLDADYRTAGVRKALGTWNGSARVRDVKDGSLKIHDKVYQVQELDSKVMKEKNGTAWSSAMSEETMAYWLWKFGDKIDLVISNNDSMALACIKTKGFPRGIPVFGYDANDDALNAIEKGEMVGSISQSYDYQAAMIMLMMRNLVDGVHGDDCVATGVSVPDRYGNKIAAPMSYDRFSRTVLVRNSAVTKNNLAQFRKKFRHDGGIKAIEKNGTEKKILMTVGNSSLAFESQQLVPAMKYYAEQLNLSLTILNGNGRNDSAILQQIGDVSEYDGFLLNLVSTNQGRAYLERIR